MPARCWSTSSGTCTSGGSTSRPAPGPWRTCSSGSSRTDIFPDRLDAYAKTIRKLGNVGTHRFGEQITAADVYQSLTQLMPILEWYFEVERPDAAGRRLDLRPSRPAVKPPEPTRSPADPEPTSPSSPRGCGRSTPTTADFFLDLLPGPRDKDGLPESIRFWKHRIESGDEPTFTVGVIYGPSGCGKSSLVKAGLLPRLARRSPRSTSRRPPTKPRPGCSRG